MRPDRRGSKKGEEKKSRNMTTRHLNGGQILSNRARDENGQGDQKWTQRKRQGQVGSVRVDTTTRESSRRGGRVQADECTQLGRRRRWNQQSEWEERKGTEIVAFGGLGWVLLESREVADALVSTAGYQGAIRVDFIYFNLNELHARSAPVSLPAPDAGRHGRYIVRYFTPSNGD